MIYGKFDEQGFPLGFWVLEACSDPDVIPEDAVEISEAQHIELLENAGGRRFVDGEVIVHTPPPPDPLPPPMPVPQLVAVSLLQVIGDEVITVGVSAGVSFAMRMDTGLIWVFFSEEMPDVDYSYSYTVTPSTGRGTVTDRQLSYMEITVTDNDGIAVDPAEISVQVYRATT